MNSMHYPRRFLLTLLLSSLAGPALGQGTDSCASPQLIVGAGTFAFDNNGATTGIEGQTCTFINSDIWLEWTADFSGTCEFSTCGATFDTKIAAYPATGACPLVGSALGCNDDACGVQSTITFPVTSGSAYLLQIGSYSASTQGSGNFTLIAFGACQDDFLEDNDDCAMPALAPQGLTSGLWIAGDGALTGADGDFYGVTVAPGETLTVDIYFTHTSGDTDLFLYDLNGGSCGVGYSAGTNLAYGYSASDNESVSWINTGGSSVDVIIHVDAYGTGFDCNTYDMDVQGGSSQLGTRFCFGDNSDGLFCPCGNLPTLGSEEGCTHAGGVGAYLTASGSARALSDTLVLTLSQGEPGATAIFVQNIQQGSPMPYFDGGFCLAADANLVRHYAPWNNVHPTVLDGSGSGVNAQVLSVGDFLGLTMPGTTMHYQVWYQSSVGPCGSGSNFSSGVSIRWN